MFGLSAQGFYTLLLIAFVLLAIAFIRIYRRKLQKNRFRVGVRVYRDPRKPKQSSSSSLWVCPQCFTTTAESGSCPNEEHELTPVKLEPADPDRLEYYHEMQRLTGNEIED